jgi:hypothetical protein
LLHEVTVALSLHEHAHLTEWHALKLKAPLLIGDGGGREALDLHASITHRSSGATLKNAPLNRACGALYLRETLHCTPLARSCSELGVIVDAHTEHVGGVGACTIQAHAATLTLHFCLRHKARLAWVLTRDRNA